MARGKVQMKKIENPVHRQVTFCKRRSGLLKKAKELSVLCDADIGVLIFSAHDKVYELATKGTMQELIERYKNSSCQLGPGPAAARHVASQQRPPSSSSSSPTPTPKPDENEEINLLKQEIQVLQKGLGYMFGAGVGTMSLDELQVLEKHLEIWIYHIRSTKMDIMFQEIQLLRNKEGILKAANRYLLDKIEASAAASNIPQMSNGNPNYINYAHPPPNDTTTQSGLFQYY